MLPTDGLGVSGIALMLLLGLRHGLDPDHIALIDGMTLRAHQQRPAMAPWVGTWFALGHGLVVTLIAVAVSLGAGRVELPAAVSAFAEWVPVALLFAVGTGNLRSLLRDVDYQPAGWRTRLIPPALRGSTGPLGIFLIGALFAAIFDTITQAAAWGYVATQQGGVFGALMVGLVFTFGMLVTDTLDARLLCRLLRDPRPEVARGRRRALGWVIVLMAYGVVLYTLLTRVAPQLELSPAAYTATGAAMVGLLVLLIAVAVLRERRAGHLTDQSKSTEIAS